MRGRPFRRLPRHGADNGGRIRILGSVEKTFLDVVTGRASFELALKPRAWVAVECGLPKLVIQPRIVSRRVIDSELSFPWWFKLVEAALGQFKAWLATELLETVLGPLVGLFVNSAVKGMDQPGKTPTALPGGVEMRVSSTRDELLHQEGAPQVTMKLPGLPAIPLPAWEHDLVVRLEAAPLPRRLAVECIMPDGDDARRRIDAVSGPIPGGDHARRWGMTIDEAVTVVEAGQIKLVVADPATGVEAELRVVKSDSRLPFLRTDPDQTAANNLLELPKCLCLDELRFWR